MLSGLILLILLLALRTHAGLFYCINTTIEMNSHSQSVDHLVVPQEPDNPYSSKRLACRWVFTLNFTSDPILMLNGFDVAKVDLSRLRVRRSAETSSLNASRIQYRLSDGSSCSPGEAGGSWQSVEFWTHRILQLPKRTDLYIEFNQNWIENADNTPGLRIRLIERGFCSREVVNFHKNCYTTSLDRGTVKEQLTSMSRYGGQAQLASFNSAKDLQSFVTESQRKLAGSGMRTRSKIPLNFLTQPVRIGLFYQRLESSIYYLADSNGKMVMKLLPNPHQLYHTVTFSLSKISCGSLRIFRAYADHLAIVDFGDCNEPLPALLSSPDSAKNCCYSGSARAALDLLESDAATSVTKVFYESNSTNKTSDVHVYAVTPTLTPEAAPSAKLQGTTATKQVPPSTIREGSNVVTTTVTPTSKPTATISHQDDSNKTSLESIINYLLLMMVFLILTLFLAYVTFVSCKHYRRHCYQVAP